ncbi:E3 ubiquitin-protein ligase ATL41-like [Typha latifolia]|uniref:E3 ubiquitin-protein ligase ATL41-like n=1 Tax=Typha latifolia TaxID=4733 RepID=UPI003C2B2F28
MSTNESGNGVLDHHSQIDSRIVLSIALALLFVALAVVILHFYVGYILRRRRRRRDIVGINTINIFLAGSLQNPRPGLDPAIIASLPTFAYQKGTTTSDVKEEEESSKECVVCLSVLEDEEKVRQLPNCKHVFHVGCIDKWLHENSTCPVCRTDAEPAMVVEKVEVSETSALPPEVDSGGASSSKEVGTTSSRLGSSFRRILSRDWSGRRIQPADVGGEDDLERQYVGV